MDKTREEFEHIAIEIYGNEISLEFSEEQNCYIYEKTCNAFALFSAAKASEWVSAEDAILNDQNDYWVCDHDGEVFSARYWGDNHPFFGGTDGEFYASITGVTHVMKLVKPKGPSE